MFFFLSLSIEGALAGALYALVALAFVGVSKASKVINFALGEWLMLAALFIAAGRQVLGRNLAEAMALGCAGMVVFAWLFNTLIPRHLVGQPLISLLMVMLGVGTLLRGIAQLAFAGGGSRIELPVHTNPLVLNDLVIPIDKLMAPLIAALLLLLARVLHTPTRT